MKGKYIIFEGIVGSGKTTHSKKLKKKLEKEFQKKEIVWTREPGGGEIANKIRRIVQGIDYEEKMNPICEAYLYAASRAQALRTIVKPVLEKEGIVISDRSFIASMAYQGFARGLGVRKILDINKNAINSLIPDLVVFMKLDPSIGLERIRNKVNDKDDKWEKKGVNFFRKVGKGYKKISKMNIFKNKWVEVNSEGKIEDVSKRVEKAVYNFFGWE